MCDTQICTSRYGGFRQVMGTPSHHPAPQRPPTGIPRELDDTDMSVPGQFREFPLSWITRVRISPGVGKSSPPRSNNRFLCAVFIEYAFCQGPVFGKMTNVHQHMDQPGWMGWWFQPITYFFRWGSSSQVWL